MYISLVVGTVAVLGGIPLFYELVCEAVYPVAEGVANLSLTYLNNVVAMIFYVVLIFNSGRSDIYKEELIVIATSYIID